MSAIDSSLKKKGFTKDKDGKGKDERTDMEYKGKDFDFHTRYYSKGDENAFLQGHYAAKGGDTAGKMTSRVAKESGGSADGPMGLMVFDK